jgi:aspartyl-tRNA(Asn)/glutamyl-tRNA(Gln) amidotransferase subunit B
VEIKNMASIKAIADALEYEVKRQIEIVNSGGEIYQETRLFDEAGRCTVPMRSKEDAPDYRYFPDPDLVEVEIDEPLVERIRRTLPELPQHKAHRLMDAYEISDEEARLLLRDRGLSDYFESCAPHCDDPRKLCGWMTRELNLLLQGASLSIDQCLVGPERFARLINLITTGKLTEKIGRSVLEEMFLSGEEPEAIVDRLGLKPIKDEETLGKIVEEVISENPDSVTKIKDGDQRPVNFLVGQVMNKTHGKAHAQKVKDIIGEKLSL